MPRRLHSAVSREKIVFAHGMEGSPRGTKATYLRQKLGAVAPWLGELDLDGQVDRLAEEIGGGPPAVVVGSSLGGLAVLGLAVREPHLVSRLVLLAPAVGMDRFEGMDPAAEERRPGLFAQSRKYSALAIPPQIPATVIHGLEDDVIRLEDVLGLVRRSPSARLIAVHDDHALRGSRELILSAVSVSYERAPGSTSY